MSGLAGLVLLGVAGWLAAGTGTRSRARRFPRLRKPKPTEVTAEQAAGCALLIAACLEAGATPAAALRQAAAAGDGEVTPALGAAADQLEAGAVRPAALSTGTLRPLGAVFGRSMLTGSAMSAQLVEAAQQLRTEAQFVRLERARRVGVLSALPLGACMLPAFVLLAVVPTVLGLASGL